MPLKFWQKPASQEMPLTVKDTVMSQFGLASESVDKMRVVGQPGRLANQQVRLIRIFDPALISDGEPAKAKYYDFQLEFSGDRKALLFEGHIDKDGKVFLSDKRLRKNHSKRVEAPAGLGQ